MLLLLLITATFSQANGVVKSGGCYDNTNRELIHCAASADECEQDLGITYKSADNLMDNECTTDNLPIGSCKTSGKCAITKYMCSDEDDYEPPQPFGRCNAVGDYEDDSFVPTQYGGCEDRVTGAVNCVLTPKDCEDGEAWISVYEGCNCHNVKIGFCASYNNGQDTCAISSDDCSYTEFVSPRSNRHASLDCRLCADDIATIFEGVENSPNEDPETEEELEASALHAGEIVGIVLGAITTVLFVAIGLFAMFSHEAEREYLHIDPFAKEGDFNKREAPSDVPDIA